VILSKGESGLGKTHRVGPQVEASHRHEQSASHQRLQLRDALAGTVRLLGGDIALPGQIE